MVEPRPRRIELAPLTQWITAAAIAHGADLPAHVAERLNVTPRRAAAVLRRLAQAQWLQRRADTRRVVYEPGPLRQVVQRYPLAGLQEDEPWRRDFAPFFVLPPHVRQMARHAFTELLNNAIDHSGGTSVTVSMRQTPLQLQLLVSDDGCGLFQNLAQNFAIDDPAQAVFELSKGGLTSRPGSHQGQGLFFASQLADVLDLHANAAAFQCRNWERRQWRAGRPATRAGTSIYLAISLDTQRTLDGVLRAHSRDGVGYGIERTVVPLQLLASDAALVSRAEARRASARLARFAMAELDFSGIEQVGPGFADELFRVFGAAHPGLTLSASGMNAQVAALVAAHRAPAQATVEAA